MEGEGWRRGMEERDGGEGWRRGMYGRGMEERDVWERDVWERRRTRKRAHLLLYCRREDTERGDKKMRPVKTDLGVVHDLYDPVPDT